MSTNLNTPSLIELDHAGGATGAGATRNALLLTALDEFAANGIAGTSIGQLTKKAGVRNSSALHYHFGSKSGLIDHLVRYIQDWFDREREDRFQALEARLDKGGKIALREVLELLVEPYTAIIAREPWGLSAVRFLNALEFERQPSGWEIFHRQSSAVVQRIFTLILTAVDGGDRIAQQATFLFFVDSIIHGFASHERLQIPFFGKMPAATLQELAQFYVDCGERLLSPAGTSTRIAWRTGTGEKE
ncbi:MAG: TetR/AcrR family transcriptional regulator [Pseudomonadota bacterium]